MDKREADERAREAEQALASAEYDRALGIYHALSLARVNEGVWPHREADIHRRRHAITSEVEALVRAADRYREGREVLRSLVMCKRLLALAPEHPDTERCLSLLHPMFRATSPDERPRSVAPDSSPDGWLSLGAPLAAIPFARVLPGGTPAAAAWPAEIPIATEVRPTFDLVEAVESDLTSGDGARARLAPHPSASLGGVASSLRPEDVVPKSVRHTPLFAALSERTFRRLLTRLRLVELAKGRTLFRQGSKGESLYMVCMGKVSVTRESSPSGASVELATLDEAEFFGEISVFTDHLRTATVIAKTDALLLEIDRRVLSELLYEDPDVMPVLLWFLRDRLVDTLVRTSDLFEGLPLAQRRSFADRFRFLEADRDALLIEQGKLSRGLVIVLSGRLEVVRDDEGRRHTLAQLGPGDIVGEMSLIAAEPAVATVTSRGRFIGLFIPAEEFRALAAAGPLFAAKLASIAEVRRRHLAARRVGAEAFRDGALPVL